MLVVDCLLLFADPLTADFGDTFLLFCGALAADSVDRCTIMGVSSGDEKRGVRFFELHKLMESSPGKGMTGQAALFKSNSSKAFTGEL